jgi:hypothetical protein
MCTSRPVLFQSMYSFFLTVMPVQVPREPVQVLRKLSLVQAGDTGAILYEPTSRSQADTDDLRDRFYPGGILDALQGRRDGSRLWHTSPWALGWPRDTKHAYGPRPAPGGGRAMKFGFRQSRFRFRRCRHVGPGRAAAGPQPEHTQGHTQRTLLAITVLGILRLRRWLVSHAAQHGSGSAVSLSGREPGDAQRTHHAKSQSQPIIANHNLKFM